MKDDLVSTITRREDGVYVITVQFVFPLDIEVIAERAAELVAAAMGESMKRGFETRRQQTKVTTTPNWTVP